MSNLADTNNQQNEVKLRRVIGLFDGIQIILGTIIGSGIFISPSGVLGEVKSVYTSLLIWLFCGLVSILGAFCFAELAYLVPKAGSGYAYLNEGFSSLSRFGNIPAFLSCWMSAIIITPGSAAVLSLTSAEYLSLAIFGKCPIDATVDKCMAIIFILIASIVNCYSVGLSSRVNSVFSVGKIVALLLIIVFGIINLSKGYTDYLKPDFAVSDKSAVNYARAFYFGLFAYDGWFALNNLVEELKNPRRNLPLAISISLILIIVLYLMANISYLTLLSPSDMVSSSAVALLWAEKAFGKYSIVILIAVFVSTYGSCLSLILSNSRIIFACARDSNLPIILSMIDINYLTPTPSIIFTAIVSIIMILVTDIFTLLDFFTFLIWIFYGLDMIALIILKRRRSNSVNIEERRKEKYRLELPMILPIIMLLFCIFLIISSLLEPNIGHLIALAVMLSGLAYYFPFVYLKKTFKITVSYYLDVCRRQI